MTGNQGPRLRPHYNPGNARWCMDHGRMECTGNRSRGRGPCHGPAIRGTRNCRIHSGKQSKIAREKGLARITAWDATGQGAQQVDYRMAVLGVLQMTWLRLAAYSDLLRKQVEKEGLAAGPDPHDPTDADASGLIGFRYGAAGKDGNIFAQSEEIRALVLLEGQERDKVVKYAKTAHDMGISDRLTNLAERWGDVVATRISLMLEALELNQEQSAKVPALIQAHLGSIDVDSMNAEAQK